jgi:hypothetical protein
VERDGMGVEKTADEDRGEGGVDKEADVDR